MLFSVPGTMSCACKNLSHGRETALRCPSFSLIFALCFLADGPNRGHVLWSLSTSPIVSSLVVTLGAAPPSTWLSSLLRSKYFSYSFASIISLSRVGSASFTCTRDRIPNTAPNKLRWEWRVRSSSCYFLLCSLRLSSHEASQAEREFAISFFFCFCFLSRTCSRAIHPSPYG